jgi:hypothetical protein
MIDTNKLSRWYTLTQEIEERRSEELTLRKELFGAAFPDPSEGGKDNKMNLADGWILQGDYKINRTVDRAVVDILAKGDNTAPLVDKVFDYKPSLVLKEWRALSAEDRILLADAVTEKPGTPALKVVLPKRG